MPQKMPPKPQGALAKLIQGTEDYDTGIKGRREEFRQDPSRMRTKFGTVLKIQTDPEYASKWGGPAEQDRGYDIVEKTMRDQGRHDEANKIHWRKGESLSGGLDAFFTSKHVFDKR